MTERIDAHHHLWRYSPEEYEWIDDTMIMLRHDFLRDDLVAEMRLAGVDGAIAVQARQTLQETQWLLDIADASEAIRGVVGWAPIASKEFVVTMSEFLGRPKLKGLRHIVQAEQDDFLLSENFNRGISAMSGSGLVYDLLVYERQLLHAIQFVDMHPDQAFVLDHIAKPRIREAVLEPWASRIQALAKRENVVCKISGLVTEADWKAWTLETLRPYLDVVVGAFGPHRLMVGSDWPVCLAASGYGQWFDLLGEYFARFTVREREAVFGETAKQVYKLESGRDRR